MTLTDKEMRSVDFMPQDSEEELCIRRKKTSMFVASSDVRKLTGLLLAELRNGSRSDSSPAPPTTRPRCPGWLRDSAAHTALPPAS